MNDVDVICLHFVDGGALPVSRRDNPDATATVRHGPQTHHEMMYGFFFYTDATERLGLQIDPKTGQAK